MGKLNKGKFLFRPVLCEGCKRVMVRKVYTKFSNKPLCIECRTPRAERQARQEFNSAGRGWLEIVQNEEQE